MEHLNFLQLANMVLQELNFKQVETFEELIKPDHKRILSIINRVNNIVLEQCDWRFMGRELEFDIPANADRVTIPPSLKIKKVYAGDLELFYTEEYDRLLNGRGCLDEFSVFNSTLLLRPSPISRKLKLIYLTKNHAKDASGKEIPKMVSSDDITIMPPEYAQTVIIFGTCMQFKSNPQHPKYKHWRESYTNAIAEMRANDEFVKHVPPALKLPRWALGYDRYRRGY